MADEQTETEGEEVAAKGGKGKLIIMLVAAIALGGGGFFGATMFMGGDEPSEEAAAAEAEPEVTGANALYYPILPPLTTNFSDDVGRRRFMQVSLEVRAREQSAIDAVKDHNAVIRNALLMAYSDVNYEAAITREGKEALRVTSLEEVQRVLEEQTGSPGIDDIFFTQFVIQ
ncbi:MAG: flagellar basal body-associated FliL family protein [Planctomycetota bacterium]